MPAGGNIAAAPKQPADPTPHSHNSTDAGTADLYKGALNILQPAPSNGSGASSQGLPTADRYG